MATEKPSDVVGTGELRSSRNIRTGLILGATFGIKPVQYAIVDGDAIFEGDIVLGTEAQVAQQTEHLRAASSGRVAMGVVRSGSQYRWPNCQIPYDIDPGLANQARVTDAIAHWESNTQFRFVLRTAQNAAQYPDWVTFRTSTGCSSSVGRQGGQQFVSLGPGCSTGNAIHEIGHVIGLWHEQSREDRDSFVTIHWDKIQAGMEHNFDQRITDGDDVGNYDYGSIMHYPRNAFSVDGSDTITPVDPAANIGQRTALSTGDIAAANSLCPKLPPADIKFPKEPPLDRGRKPLKEIPFDTRKELIKDIRFDTRKEPIPDTRKELLKDRIKEVAYDPPFVKGPIDRIRPGIGGYVRPAPGVTPGGSLPFAVAVPHQAPMAAGGGAPAGSSLDDSVAQLDAQLQALAEALHEAETHCEALQQQYNETAAMLQQALDAYDQSMGG